MNTVSELGILCCLTRVKPGPPAPCNMHHQQVLMMSRVAPHISLLQQQGQANIANVKMHIKTENVDFVLAMRRCFATLRQLWPSMQVCIKMKCLDRWSWRHGRAMKQEGEMWCKLLCGQGMHMASNSEFTFKSCKNAFHVGAEGGRNCPS